MVTERLVQSQQHDVGPFLGASGEDVFSFAIPPGEVFDSASVTVDSSVRAGANLVATPMQGETGSLMLTVHWWIDAGIPAGKLNYTARAFSETVAAGVSQQFLDFRRALDAGAKFAVRLDPPQPTYFVGVIDARDSAAIPYRVVDRSGVLCVVDPVGAARGGPAGTPFGFPSVGLISPPSPGVKAHFALFKDFKLKNGWKVKSVSVDRFILPPGLGNSKIPASKGKSRIGSNDPGFAAVVWTEPGGILSVLQVTTVIEGPTGTDPY